MRLEDVTADTEATFLRCLHDEAPDDPRVMSLRRRHFDARRGKGLRAKVLILDTGEVVALCQYMPIEETHILGDDLVAILCMWVHGYDHHVGNRQGRGHGRYMLACIEEDARQSGVGGVAAWGMSFSYWNPVSFYEHMGYTRVDEVGEAVLVWKPFRPDAVAPRFLRQRRRPVGEAKKVAVTAFVNGWCTGGCAQAITAREAVAGLEEVLDYREIDTSDRGIMLSWGVSNGLFVDGKDYRPYEPPVTSEVLRGDLLDLAALKGLPRPQGA